MKNKKLLLLLACIALILDSQELDSTYLDSLPEDIKKDVLNRSKEKGEDAKDLYRPSQFSSKLEEIEDLNKLKSRIELDLIELERRLDSDDRLLLPGVELFGSNFFNTFQTSYMPINEPNPDSAYTLDTGDILNVQLIGQQDFIKAITINREGSINIPDIGKVNVAGLSLMEASNLIKAKVNAVFIGTEAYINLDQIRDINILVTGNAKNPGIYTLTGNSNLLHAVSMAGGINEFGSFREINLVRNNKIIETLDIYDLLINGNYNVKSRLRSGDVVFVAKKKNIIKIDGAVHRPAMYELKSDQSLEDIIFYANGLKQSADRENISLERVLDGTLKSIPLINETQLKSIKPIDGDLVYIREFPFRKALILGSVYKPGEYTMAAGESLLDLVEKAGGYTPNAYPFGTVYENDEAKEINKNSKEVLYNDFLDNIITMSQQNISENFDLNPIIALIRDIRDSKPNGRIVIDLVNEGMAEKVKIKSGDKVVIPELTNNVYVYGEVSTEGAVMYQSNEGVDYFIKKSGGLKKFADNEAIYVLHPNGETERYSRKKNIFESQPNGNVTVYPGSVIYVPRKIDNTSTRRIAAQAYVSILGNIGVALASLSSINNN